MTKRLNPTGKTVKRVITIKVTKKPQQIKPQYPNTKPMTSVPGNGRILGLVRKN